MTGPRRASESSLVRAVGAYVRATAKVELPAGLRHLRGFTDRGLMREKDRLLAALDSDALRQRIAEWLETKPSLGKAEAETLRAAIDAGDAWRDALSSDAATPEAPVARKVPSSDESLARERERTRRLREEAKKAREEARGVAAEGRAKVARLEDELTTVRSELKEARSAAKASSSAEERALAALERERRKAKRDLDRAHDAVESLRKRLKDVERARARLEKEAAARAEPPRPASRQRQGSPRARTGPRRPLPIPKGLFENAPETLESWLEADGVRLVVDGYNVAKAEGGFGTLELEGQRERVVQEVARLARRKKAHAVVVFDGSEIPPGTSRRVRGPATVEYSRPDETADDHIVVVVAALPPDPVVVVTNDRELQDRVRALGATVATSDQLLATFR